MKGAWDEDGLSARWMAGALWVNQSGVTVLVDAPEGVSGALLRTGRLSAVRHVVLASGRIEALGGLLPLMVGLEQAGADALDVWVPAQDERVSAVVGAFASAFASRLSVAVDAVQPGQAWDAGPFRVTVWTGGDEQALAVRIEAGARAVVVARGSLEMLPRRVFTGVALAVVPAESGEALFGGAVVWRIGDDGGLVEPRASEN